MRRVVSGKEAVRALVRLGFVVVRQRGSHVRLVRASPPGAATVPMHEEIKRGTLLGLLRRAEVGRDEFYPALER